MAVSARRRVAALPVSIVAAVVVSACIGAGSSSNGPRTPDNFISRALFADGRLWLLSDRGALSSIAPGGKDRTGSGLVTPVLDACVRDNHLEALTCETPSCDRWSVRVRAGEAWGTRAVVPALDERVFALSCADSADVVVTAGHVVRIAGGETSSASFSMQRSSGVASVHIAGSSVFVGLNVGEWGGGLHRIDQGGTTTTIEKNATGGICDGPLNTQCDPVNGIVDVPWHPGCVAAAVGLVHFSPHGRIVEVCNGDVHRVFFKPYGTPKKAKHGDSDEPVDTVAFFGLVRVGDRVLAAGLDGLYRFDDWEHFTVTPLPSFESIDGVGVSFEIPDVALVLTGVNRRTSLSGNVPLLAPR